MKKVILVLVTGIFLTTGILFGTSASADGSLKSYGGWSESEGYYSNQPIQDPNSFSIFATNKPDSHKGKRLIRAYNSSGDPEFAAQGITQWEGKYHYTTARMENSKGTVLTTSNRKWGYDYTLAISPYYKPGIFENVEARTYWGY